MPYRTHLSTGIPQQSVDFNLIFKLSVLVLYFMKSITAIIITLSSSHVIKVFNQISLKWYPVFQNTVSSCYKCEEIIKHQEYIFISAVQTSYE